MRRLQDPAQIGESCVIVAQQDETQAAQVQPSANNVMCEVCSRKLRE